MWSGVLSIVFEHHHPSELKLFQIDIPFHMRVFMELVSPASWLYNTLVLLCSEYGNRYAEGLSGERYHSQWLLDRISRLSSTPYLILGVQRFQKKNEAISVCVAWLIVERFPDMLTKFIFLSFRHYSSSISSIPNDVLWTSSSFLLFILLLSHYVPGWETYTEITKTCLFLGKYLCTCIVHKVSIV